MKIVRKLLLWLVGILVIYLVIILGYGTITDWAPTDEEPAQVWSGEGATPLITDSIVTFITWNVGYGGLGDQDFFFYNKGDFFWTDPGTVRMKKERVESNVGGQRSLVENSLSDFFLLQEVDTAARRSHYLNELDTVRKARPDYVTTFAPNFKSKNVPIPVFQPWDHYGAVVGGLASISRYTPAAATRIPLPGKFPWPTRLFQLDRCALRQTFTTKNGQQLVVYNIHFSAYDKDGDIRLQQMQAVREAVIADYDEGHYVVVGADWNQLPPGFNWFSLNPTVEKVELPMSIPFDFMPVGWKYAYDPATATNRESDLPYDSHRSRRTVIDFFLLSPNIRIKEVKGLEMGFRDSDHQPVYLEAELLGQ